MVLMIDKFIFHVPFRQAVLPLWNEKGIAMHINILAYN